MSVIAWDGKVLAADRQISHNDRAYEGQKLFRLDDGTLVAFTGDRECGMILVEWVRSGADSARWPAFQKHDDFTTLVVVRTDGQVFQLQAEPYWHRITEPFYAWGVGAPYALGAMACGATAEHAVTVANSFSVWCGCGVTSYAAAAV